MEYPLVSAIVLCYNHERYITECLESIRLQAYPNLELIINDNASRDNSVAVIRAWLTKCSMPHRLIESGKNQGICRSMNTALSCARGKYISGIAADDTWLSGKLRRQVQIMEQMPTSFGVVYSDALQMDESGRLLPNRFMEADGRNRGFQSAPEGDVHLALWRDNFIAPMTTLIRRECFQRVGLFDENLFAEDWDMWLRISRCYQFAYSPEVTAKYRIVGSSATRSRFGSLVDDMCQTCVKHLRTSDLAPEARQAATIRLHELASTSFKRRSLRHKQNLAQAMRYRPSVGLAGRLVCAMTGLGPERWDRLRSLLKIRG